MSVTVAESFLREYDAEMKTTRRLLERIPIDRLAWTPHAKSRALGALATHVTELPRWGQRFTEASFTIGSAKAPELKTTAEFLARFDENVAAGRAGIAGMSDEGMGQEFTVFRPDGGVFFKLKRALILRNFLLSHLIHHRGQLTVYMRQNDVPLPSIYGPTADEAV